MECLIEEFISVRDCLLEADSFREQPVTPKLELKKLGTGRSLLSHEILTLFIECQLYILEGDFPSALLFCLRIYQSNRVHKEVGSGLQLQGQINWSVIAS